MMKNLGWAEMELVLAKAILEAVDVYLWLVKRFNIKFKVY